MSNDDWKPIEITGGDGATTASGKIDLDRAVETHPCFMCKSFDKDAKKLREHLHAHGLRPGRDGRYTTPIAKDFPGRKPLKIYLPDWGFCRKNTHPVDMQATCSEWEQVQSAGDMASRIR